MVIITQSCFQVGCQAKALTTLYNRSLAPSKNKFESITDLDHFWTATVLFGYRPVGLNCLRLGAIPILCLTNLEVLKWSDSLEKKEPFGLISDNVDFWVLESWKMILRQNIFLNLRECDEVKKTFLTSLKLELSTFMHCSWIKLCKQNIECAEIFYHSLSKPFRSGSSKCGKQWSQRLVWHVSNCLIHSIDKAIIKSSAK